MSLTSGTEEVDRTIVKIGVFLVGQGCVRHSRSVTKSLKLHTGSVDPPSIPGISGSKELHPPWARVPKESRGPTQTTGRLTLVVPGTGMSLIFHRLVRVINYRHEERTQGHYGRSSVDSEDVSTRFHSGGEEVEEEGVCGLSVRPRHGHVLGQRSR